MTVIAANLHEMAADSLISVTDCRPYYTCKLVRLYDGSIAAAAGTGYEYLMAWMKAGELSGNEPEYKPGQDFQLVRLKKDGIYMYVNSCIPDKVKDRMVAVGSGANVALYVMKYVKKSSPAIAVRESIKVSPGCGGNVDVMRLK